MKLFLSKLLQNSTKRSKKQRRRLHSTLLRSEQLEMRRLLAADVWINELHYDNVGTDADEFVEVAGPAGTDLTGWSIHFYNGSNGTVYSSLDLSGFIIDDESSTGFGALSFAQSGIQNGAPDGLALVDDLGAVIQFLSYEGTLTAVGGPADGMLSIDIGVLQSGTEAVDLSLQLEGIGTTYADFNWAAAPSLRSPGTLNLNQSIAGANAGVLVATTGAGNSVNEAGPTSDSFTVALTQQPTDDVVITLSVLNGQITLDTPAVLTFTAADFSTPQTVSFTAIDDSVVERLHTDEIAFVLATSSPNYAGVTVPNQLVEITDNDFGDLIPSVINEFVADHTGSDSETFAEILSQPNSDLIDLTIIELEGDATGVARGVIDKAFTLGTTDADGYYVIPNSAGFDPENITMTLLLVYGFTGSVTQDLDTNDDGILDITPWLSIVDSVGLSSDAAHFVYSPVALTKVSADGTTVFGGASRIPNGQDTDSVNDWVSNDFTGEGLAIGGFAAPGQAINTPGLPNRVKPGVNIVQSDGTTVVTEGGAGDSIAIVLYSAPTSDVTISVAPDGQLTTDASTFTFTPTDWNVPQTLNISALNDTISEGDHTGTIAFTSSSSDADYDLVAINPLTVGITDNDSVGVTIEPTAGLVTTEAGGSAVFSVVLNSPPSADVAITVNSSDESEGSASPSLLTFTALNWNTPQPVTITGVDDAVDDGDINYTISFSVQSFDFQYDNLSVPALAVVNLDDEFNTSALLSEISVNPPSTDNPFEFIELIGEPGSSLDGFYFVQIEGDGAPAGSADFVVDLSGFSFGSNGLLVITAPGGGHTIPAETTVVTDAQLNNGGGGLENGTVTSLLIFSSVPVVEGQDYDAENDGLLELPTGAVVQDSVAWTDGGSGDVMYSSAQLSQSTGTPDAATRFLNNTTQNNGSSWYNGDLIDTIGSSSLGYNVAAASAIIPENAVLTPGEDNFDGPAAQLFSITPLASLPEGNVGVTVFEFTVTRSGGSAGVATVGYTFAAGSTDADDFGGVLPTGGQVQFTDGATTSTISIEVSGDELFEPDESFSIELTSSSVGVIVNGARQATGTVLNDDVEDAVPPQIASVIAASSDWSSEFIDSVDGDGVGNGIGIELATGMDPLPWIGVDRLYIQFTEDVSNIDATTVELQNSDGLVSRTVSYDAVTFVATIELASPLTFSKLRLAVADTVTDMTGNALDGDDSGAAGGIFNFRFDVMPGDANGDDRVNGSDLTPFSLAFNSQIGQPNYNPRANWNGDQRVNGADLSVFSAFFNRQLDSLAEPQPPFGGGGGGASAFRFHSESNSRDDFFAKFSANWGDDEEEDDKQQLLIRL